MISTPETGVDSIAVTWALLDPIMTVVRPVAAFITALTTGLLIDLCDRDAAKQKTVTTPGPGTVLPMAPVNENGPICCGGTVETPSTGKSVTAVALHKLKKGMSFSFGTLLAEIGPWLLFGIGLAAIITVFISPEFIHSFLGSGAFSMVVMIALATPLYVCATASTPIAAALALKGLSPGAALVFLLAGPATNMATITVIAKMLGKKTAVIYVVSIMGCSLLIGLAVNWLYLGLGLSIAGWVDAETDHTYGIIYTLSALVLLFFIIKPWLKKLYKKMRSLKSNSKHITNNQTM